MEGLRQSARGTTGKVIIVIAVIAFVFLGSIAVLGNLSFGSIKVNGEKVTPKEIGIMYNRIHSTYSQFGFSDEDIEREALTQVVNNKALSTTLNSMNVVASNQLVEETIRDIPEFAVDGEFNMEKLQAYLDSQYLTLEQFKDSIIESTNSQQFQQGAFNTDFVSNSEAAQLYALKNQSRTFQVMSIAQSDFIDSVEVPTQESIQLYYDTNRTNFMTQESSEINYLTLDVKKLVGELEVSEEEVTDAYDAYVEVQKAKATRTVSHILVSTDDRSSDEAKEIAQNAIAKLEAGEEFASVVTEFSDDIASKDIGGYFGQISTDSVGDIDFKLGASLLSEIGEYSAPVQTQYGFHIIRLDALNELSVDSLEDKIQELTVAIQTIKQNDALQVKVDEINNAKYEVDSLEELSVIYEGELTSNIVVFRNSSEAVVSNNEVKEAAFSEKNRDEELLSDAITSIDNSIVIVEIVEYLPEQIKPLTDVNGEILDILVKSGADELAKAKADEVIAMYKGTLVADLSLEGFDDSQTVTNSDASVNATVKGLLFSMPKSSQVVSVSSVKDGDSQVVIVLTQVENAQVDMESDEFAAYKQSLESQAMSATQRSFQTYVIDTAVTEGI